MVKCPVCKKEINELDESCPYCHIIFDDMIDEDFQETEELIEEIKEENNQAENNTKDLSICNADKLNIMANVNIIISIVGAFLLWCNFSTIEITKKYTYTSGTYTDTVINWYGILGGVGILIAGFTLFFLLKTVADIYWEVEK